MDQRRLDRDTSSQRVLGRLQTGPFQVRSPRDSVSCAVLVGLPGFEEARAVSLPDGLASGIVGGFGTDGPTARKLSIERTYGRRRINISGFYRPKLLVVECNRGGEECASECNISDTTGKGIDVHHGAH